MNNLQGNHPQANNQQTFNQQVHPQQGNNPQANMINQKTQIIPVVDPEMLVKYRALEVEVAKLTK